MKNSARPRTLPVTSPLTVAPTHLLPRSPTPNRYPTTECLYCGTPECLAMLRSHLPPANMLDFVDRHLRLSCSGHWTWREGICLLLLGLVPAIPLTAFGATTFLLYQMTNAVVAIFWAISIGIVAAVTTIKRL